MKHPSLLSDAVPAQTGGPGGRILADIDGRNPPRATAPRRPGQRRWPIWLAVALPCLAVAALVPWLWRAPLDDAPNTAASTPAPALITASPAMPDNGGAMIIDDRPIDQPAPALATADNTPANVAADTNTPSTPRSKTGSGATPAATASAGKRGNAPPVASSGKATKEPELLRALLGIIKQEKPASAKHESMDSLINQLQADEKRNATATQATFDSLAPTSSDSSIQTQLRRCPAANTAQGIECRRKVCAAVTGRDPACPTTRL